MLLKTLKLLFRPWSNADVFQSVNCWALAELFKNIFWWQYLFLTEIISNFGSHSAAQALEERKSNDTSTSAMFFCLLACAPSVQAQTLGACLSFWAIKLIREHNNWSNKWKKKTTIMTHETAVIKFYDLSHDRSRKILFFRHPFSITTLTFLRKWKLR